MKLKGRGVYFQLLNAPKYNTWTLAKKNGGKTKQNKKNTPSKKFSFITYSFKSQGKKLVSTQRYIEKCPSSGPIFWISNVNITSVFYQCPQNYTYLSLLLFPHRHTRISPNFLCCSQKELYYIHDSESLFFHLTINHGLLIWV